MITREKAFRIAEKIKPGFDGCDEYEDAFVFSAKKDDDTIGKGPVVIFKKDGSHLYSFAAYLDSFSPNFIRKIL